MSSRSRVAIIGKFQRKQTADVASYVANYFAAEFKLTELDQCWTAMLVLRIKAIHSQMMMIQGVLIVNKWQNSAKPYECDCSIRVYLDHLAT